MKKLSTLILSVLLAVIVLVPAACSDISPFSDNPAIATEQPLATEPDYPVTGRLDFSKLPLPGEDVELSFSIDIVRIWKGSWDIGNMERTSDTLVDSKAWITVKRAGIDGSYSDARKYTEIPVEELVVSGDTSWEGNALENRSIKLINTIRFPDDGLWYFTGHFTGDNWSRPLTFSYAIAIADGMTVPYYLDDLRSSPLAYLQYFNYGQITTLPPNEQRPVYLELDMAHPPLAGEEVEITFRVLSPFYDVENLKIEAGFRKRTEYPRLVEEIPTRIIVSSEFEWKIDKFYNAVWNTDIIKTESWESSCIIKFPEPGEWEINIHGECVLPDKGFFETGEHIELTITNDRAYYGWQEHRPGSSAEVIEQENASSGISGYTWAIIAVIVVPLLFIIAFIIRKRRNSTSVL